MRLAELLLSFFSALLELPAALQERRVALVQALQCL